MLFPELGQEYYGENDRSLLAKMNKDYHDSYDINNTYQVEAQIDTRFEAGDQGVYETAYGRMTNDQLKTFNFNKIRPVVSMISGWQRRNRKSNVCTPIENGDADTAGQFTKLLMWNNRQEGVLETISDAFKDSLVAGISLLQVWMDFQSDPVNGNIRVDNCAYNTFFIDPHFKKKDLSDCNFIWKRSYLTRRDCKALLPDKSEIIDELPVNSKNDGKFAFMPETNRNGKNNLMSYDEYYYKDTRKQRILIDTQTGETQEWRGDDEMLETYLRTYPTVIVYDSDISTVKMAVVVQGKVMYDGPNTLGIDKYPFVPVFAYFYPQIEDNRYRIQGVVRGLRDAQYIYNRRKVIELDILESQKNTAFIYKVGALVDIDDVNKTGQGISIAVKDNAQMSDIQQIVAPPFDPTLLQVSDIIGKEIPLLAGANEELLGSATDDKAGILSMLRQGAGLTTLQGLFDQLDYSQKLLGELRLSLFQANFTPGKVKRIIEEEPTAQFYNKSFGTYDVTIEDGVNTATQRQMQFAQLMELRNAGIEIPSDVILNAATLENKSELVKAIQEQAQQTQQAQQRQMDIQEKELQSRIELNKSQGGANIGLGIERVSRVKENEAFATERRAEARKDSAAGMLDLVKAIKEIDDIDINQVKQMLDLARILNVQGRIDDKEAAKSTMGTIAQASQQLDPGMNTPSQIG